LSFSLTLTKAEKEWIKSHNPIKVGVTDIPNLCCKTNKGFKGFSVDLFKEISKDTGMKFKFIRFKNQQELYDAAKKGEIDIVFLSEKTPQKLKYLLFTDSVLSLHNHILLNSQTNYHNPNEILNQKIAVTKASAAADYLRMNYPQIKLVFTDNDLQALKLLNNKKVDAVVAELVSANHFIKKYNLNNIMPGAMLNKFHLRIASLSSEPILNDVLTESIENMPQCKLKSIMLKWGYLREKVMFFDKKTLTFISILFLMLGAFLIYMWRMNQRLKKEIEHKEELLHRLEKLRDSKLNQINEIISMIAHQWKQPLNNLGLLHQLIIHQFRNGMLDEKAMEYFEKNAKEQLTIMSQIIADFRELFKIKESPKEFDLNKLLQQAINECSLSCKQHKIKILYESKGDNFTIHGYPQTLKQVIMNILYNAKDAIIEKNPPKKEIYVKLKKQKDNFVIEIEDTAGGIPLDIIDKIFEPYFTTKRKQNGSGLGLYMAKVILEERMDGKIIAENTENGAKFTLILKDISN